MTGAVGADSAWRRAALAAAAFALDPQGAGIVVRGGPGSARDAWLSQLREALPAEAPLRRIPATIADDRLLGGLDIAATLRAGRPVAEMGVIAQADGGVLVLSMAERVSARAASRLGAALDTNVVRMERDGFSMEAPARVGLVALDESSGDNEGLPAALFDRCAYVIDLTAVGWRDTEPSRYSVADFKTARARLREVIVPTPLVEALVAAAQQLGVHSLRAPLFALRAARALCALDGRTMVESQDVALAASLTLAPRATQLPPGYDDTSAESVEPPEARSERPDHAQGANEGERAPETMEDIVLAAARAAIPTRLLQNAEDSRGARTRLSGEGRSGANIISARRGRPIGVRAGSPREGRLSLLSTLRAAAPWQPVRRRDETHLTGRTMIVRPEDFRIVRFRQPRGSTAIFALDASGSAAMQRMAEAKGAIELLLADCYIRRDSVALIAFRGQGAEIVLPPTRSMARARRRLSGLPGGGGTPLASGIDAAGALADQVRRKGQTPLVVLMTDGRANVCRDGSAGRARAMEQALEAGRRLLAEGIGVLAIDTSPPARRPDKSPTQLIAEAMGGRYVRLPLADAGLVNEAVRATLAQSGP